MIKVVVLVLTVWNSANGDKLYEINRDYDWFSISGDRMEDCRKYGVTIAHRLTNAYRKKYLFAFTNVNCHWETRPGEPA